MRSIVVRVSVAETVFPFTSMIGEDSAVTVSSSATDARVMTMSIVRFLPSSRIASPFFAGLKPWSVDVSS
jgi:hypothetical protein